MRFGFLYDRTRHLFSIGYRMADATGPGRLDVSRYDLLASEARVASFLAIAKGDVPEAHWFHLGRSVTSVRGVPVLISWSGSLFEYFMPLLLMRRYPDTLLDVSCRQALARQIEYADAHNVPWGISESAYNLTDRLGNYQYKAFGVPGLGLKRGLADELVVAPYASALGAMLRPGAATDNLRDLDREQVRGDYGFFDAIDYTNRQPLSSEDPAHRGRGHGIVVPNHFAHHQGMILVALSNVSAERPNGAPLPRRPARSRDRPAAAGARPARGADAQRQARGRHARAAVAAGHDRAAVPLAAQHVSPHAVPLERPVHRRASRTAARAAACAAACR